MYSTKGMAVPSSLGIVRPNNGYCAVSSRAAEVEMGLNWGYPRRPETMDVGMLTALLAAPRMAHGSLSAGSAVKLSGSVRSMV